MTPDEVIEARNLIAYAEDLRHALERGRPCVDLANSEVHVQAGTRGLTLSRSDEIVALTRQSIEDELARLSARLDALGVAEDPDHDG